MSRSNSRFERQRALQAREDHQRWRDTRFAQPVDEPDPLTIGDLTYSHSPGNEGTVVSWTISVGSTVLGVAYEWQLSDEAALWEPPEPDPRREPVDIIDKIDAVLADPEHPEHIDAVVNWQLSQGERGDGDWGGIAVPLGELDDD